MTAVVTEASHLHNAKLGSQAVVKACTSPVDSAIADEWRSRILLRWKMVTEETKKRVSFTLRKHLARYFRHVAKIWEEMDCDADSKLLQEHLYGKPPLHTRRTLDQFYYWTLQDTKRRDQDQVVYRETRALPSYTGIKRVVMVDQLWLWILGEGTYVSFSLASHEEKNQAR